MRAIIRDWIVTIAALFLVDRFFAFVTISGTNILIAAATALYLLNTIGKPFLKILWLPINIITLGLFSWVVNILVILIVVFFVPGFTLTPLHIPGFQIGNFIFSEVTLKMIWTYFAFTFILSWFTGLVRWIMVDD